MANKKVKSNAGDKIKETRKAIGLTQKALAEHVGVTTVTLNRWENGKSNPSRLAFFRLFKTEIPEGAALMKKKTLLKTRRFWTRNPGIQVTPSKKIYKRSASKRASKKDGC